MAETIDDVAAEIRTLMGVTDDDPRSQEWRNICNSQRDCSCCGKCGKPIAAGERVCRTVVTRRSPFGGIQNNLVALCQECTEQDWHWRYRHMRVKPCEGCGRGVWSEQRVRNYAVLPVTCCEQCSHNVRLAVARKHRTK